MAWPWLLTFITAVFSSSLQLQTTPLTPLKTCIDTLTSCDVEEMSQAFATASALLQSSLQLAEQYVGVKAAEIDVMNGDPRDNQADALRNVRMFFEFGQQYDSEQRIRGRRPLGRSGGGDCSSPSLPFLIKASHLQQQIVVSSKIYWANHDVCSLNQRNPHLLQFMSTSFHPSWSDVQKGDRGFDAGLETWELADDAAGMKEPLAALCCREDFIAFTVEWL